MTFSRPILGTNKGKVELSWLNYIFTHLLPTWITTFKYNFMTWADLVWFSDNHKHYTLLKNDDPFEMCYQEFWFNINDDDIYPKELLEYLLQTVDDVETGKVQPIPFTREMMNSLTDLVGDVTIDLSDDIESKT